MLARCSGLRRCRWPSGAPWRVATALLVVAGVAFDIRDPKLRYLTAGFIVTAGAIWVVRGRSGDYYLTERLGVIVGPVLVAFSAFGWCRLVRSTGLSLNGALRFSGAIIGTAAALLFL